MGGMERPPVGTLPDRPGSYQFKDGDGRIIYVGKAKSLRSRLSNYFARPETLHPKTAQLMAEAASVEWIEVANDLEAFMLEYNLIKAHRPRFNIRLVDDKSYPYLAITRSDQWPRAAVMRGKKRSGVLYFGPYAHAHAIRETLDLLLRTFPVRTCTDGKFVRHERLGKPCLLFHIEKCVGPCTGDVTQESYDDLVGRLVRFLDGDTKSFVRELETSMRQAAESLDFERAARLRDRLTSVNKAIERQQMVGNESDHYDIVGWFGDELEMAVQVFSIRSGRVVGRVGFLVDRVEALEDPELLRAVIERHYADDPPLGTPREILVPVVPEGATELSRTLTTLRGSAVSIRVPQRGAKRELMQTVRTNAQQEFARSRLRRASDHDSRAQALRSLQGELGLPHAPLRIECYDMSHLQGTDYVGSMVVMEDGLLKRSDYRRFVVKSVPGNDDFAAMEEVLRRRLTALLTEREKGDAGKRRSFSYPPSLLLVDGGKGQLGVAARVVEELGLKHEIPIASLAKQFEEVFIPGRSEPIRIPRQAEALYVLQRLRDEAHRFAITFHRERRGKRMTKSVLDDITGLGQARRKRLLKEFGSTKAVKEASREDLLGCSWLPDAVAHAIYDRIHGEASGSGES